MRGKHTFISPKVKFTKHGEKTGDMEAHINLFLKLLSKLTALGEEIEDKFATGILLGS